MVEVAHAHADASAPRRRRGAFAERCSQQRAVGQSGQLIGRCLLFESGLDLRAVDEVFDERRQDERRDRGDDEVNLQQGDGVAGGRTGGCERPFTGGCGPVGDLCHREHPERGAAAPVAQRGPQCAAPSSTTAAGRRRGHRGIADEVLRPDLPQLQVTDPPDRADRADRGAHQRPGRDRRTEEASELAHGNERTRGVAPQAQQRGADQRFDAVARRPPQRRIERVAVCQVSTELGERDAGEHPTPTARMHQHQEREAEAGRRPEAGDTPSRTGTSSSSGGRGRVESRPGQLAESRPTLALEGTLIYRRCVQPRLEPGRGERPCRESPASGSRPLGVVSRSVIDDRRNS